MIGSTETHNNRIDAGHVLVVLLVQALSLHAVYDFMIGLIAEAVGGSTQLIWTVAVDITIWVVLTAQGILTIDGISRGGSFW